ncbi:hypothetical protein [uncultured Desulfobacter sp.]|uniref:hypothetical protein n=1 Tax=uncultured Desulfobacter sp. TaxID=240139 RepID=UPI00259B2BF9|nr:hypothetical protein [uncultured Desulfobacter sp.]
MCPEVLFFVFFMFFVVNKINCRQNEIRLKLKARVLTFYSNHKAEQKAGFFHTPGVILLSAIFRGGNPAVVALVCGCPR